MKAKRVLRTVLGLVLLAVYIVCCWGFYQGARKLKDPESAVGADASREKESAVLSGEDRPRPDPSPAPDGDGGDGEPSVQETPAPTPEPTPDPNSPAARAAALGLPEPPDIDPDSWEFVLVNEYNPVDESFGPQGPTTLEGQPLDDRIIEPMKAMVADTRAQNLSVYLSSGYRSYADQRANYNRVKANNPPDGKTWDGFWISMPPGTSEHQTGLCCDITDVYYKVKTRVIEETAMYQYMSQHCQEFGFIVRYPDGKEALTGVMYEPWHFRYVGVEAATYIMENGLCLEEFLSLYKEINTAG
ncbi:MAG: M15 family metallopeptidase [Oscillospiraceae bacterium]|nr:M15 family metallopeptidase [Oscillospiraceae bacterium]